MRALRTIVGLVLLAALAVGGWQWRTRRPRLSTPAAVSVPVTRVKPMAFETLLLATGSLEPGNSRPAVVPSNLSFSVQAEWVVHDAALVKAGDRLFRVGTREAEDRLAKLRDQVQQAQESLDQARANGARQVENAKAGVATAQQKVDMTIAGDRADVDRAQAAMERAREESDYAQAQLAKMERLFREGVATQVNRDDERRSADQQAFAAEQAVRALANAQREAAEKERAARNDLAKAQQTVQDAVIAARSSLAAAQHGIDSQRMQVADLEREIASCTVEADVPGMILLNTIWDRQSGQERLVRAGDRVWPGFIIGALIDPNRLRVACRIDEVDIRRVRPGQKVRLRVGTAKGRVFTGRLASVNPIAAPAEQGRRAFGAEVVVDHPGGELRPGTTAWLSIVVGESKQALAVPVQAICGSVSKPAVYRKRGKRFERVAVKLGARNDLSCAVLSGLRNGDEVATVTPPISQQWGAKRRRGQS